MSNYLQIKYKLRCKLLSLHSLKYKLYNPILLWFQSDGPMVVTTEPPTSCEDKWPTKRCNAQKDKNRCDKMRVIEYCQKTCGYCESKSINAKTEKDN